MLSDTWLMNDKLSSSYGSFSYVERLLTAEEASIIDERYPEMSGISLIQLMELAGAALAREAAKRLPPNGRVVICAGGGQNGGDGWVAARLLHAARYDVRVLDTASERSLPKEASINREAARSLGIPVIDTYTFCQLNAADLDLIIDALFGSGFSIRKRPSDQYIRASEKINALSASGVFIISADLPSGVVSSTGAVSEFSIKADLAVSFIRPKIGQISHPGCLQQTKIVTDPLGVPTAFIDQNVEAPAVYKITRHTVDQLLPAFSKDRHKGQGGRAALIGGSPSMPGAALLAAKAMAKSGCGYVTLVVDEALKPTLLTALPEALYAAADDDFFERMDAIAYGPGIGLTPDVSLTTVLAKAKHLVIDADGLTLLSRVPKWEEKLKARSNPAVLTPHVGEFRALDHYDPDDRVASARRLAEKTKSVVVLKGMSSVIAAPDRHALISTFGNAGLAKGGSGDVLTGIVTGLIAGGLTPFEAAAAGVYLHGFAADLAAVKFTERALLPEYVIDYLPQAYEPGKRHAKIEET